ncbi:MAG: RNA 2',3'-cyclic phosphodiesterase [Acidobacteria bacterium]|nr:MAG: RNA 2',3'-cyclic phosphodiesterase [Acidobacteriota bacterium]REK01258.1 MAG: RNA 2',3'-cyclic phosphodiesterase [Acidobacteriota bacterium]REK14214.1 MAG: RNA 2',3'-cyclic phosphodiesterase [Acidobacteriota bacterium]REK44929.1 MAG: RNA 2',3'-cyclic phosphodiesterase [Acidobacteriota bacterium]
MRAFAAIEIPENIRDRIGKYQDNLRSAFPERSLKWVGTDKLHVTLRFFQSIDSRQAQNVIDALGMAATACTSFEMTISGSGTFPNSKKPRVLWLGIDVLPVLKRLKSSIDQHLEEQGFEPETRTFRPHLTIARSKNPSKARRLADLHLSQEFKPAGFKVSRVVLMESVLKPAGSEYSLIEAFDLSG